MKAPPRLLEDPAIAPDLRQDLRRAAESSPVGYDAAAGLASLHAAIGAAPAPIGTGLEQAAAAKAGASATAGAGAAASAGAGLSGAKLALIALGTSAAIATGVATWPSARSEQAPAKPAHASVVQPAKPVAPPAITAPARPEPAPVLEPATAPAPEPATPAPDATDSDAALRSEVAQLRAIKAQLERDPERAHRLALAGQRRWKNGPLAQEREGLIVLALWAMQRRDEAREQARAFLARYPTSPLRERLQPILDGAAP